MYLILQESGSYKFKFRIENSIDLSCVGFR